MSSVKKRGKKMKVIARLLRRKEGCTSAEAKKELGWPSISLPQRARQLKIKIRSETRYWAIKPKRKSMETEANG